MDQIPLSQSPKESYSLDDISKQIRDGLNFIDLKLDEAKIQKLSKLVFLIIVINQKVNITSIKNPSEIVNKHIVDSLSIVSYLLKNEVDQSKTIKSIADIGSGGGFPAIPIAIAMPEVAICAIESIGKKAKVIEYIAEQLELKNVEVVSARAEEVAKNPDYNSSFDFAVARAVTQLPKLCHYLLPLIKSGGKMIAQKSLSSVEVEISQAKNDISQLGGQTKSIKIIETKIPETEPRALIVISKN